MNGREVHLTVIHQGAIDPSIDVGEPLGVWYSHEGGRGYLSAAGRGSVDELVDEITRQLSTVLR